MVLGTDIHWMQPVVEAQGIKQLYAEFVHINVAVLQVTCHTHKLVDCLTTYLQCMGLPSANGTLTLSALLSLHAACCKQLIPVLRILP